MSTLLTRIEAAAFCRVSLRTFSRHVEKEHGILLARDGGR